MGLGSQQAGLLGETGVVTRGPTLRRACAGGSAHCSLFVSVPGQP